MTLTTLILKIFRSNMDKNIIQFSGIVDGISLRKDSTLTIKIGTQEMSPSESAEIFKFGNKQVWIGISEIAISKLDIPDEITEFDNEKTPSERLRNVLWIYWDTKTDKSKSFEDFRRTYMDKIINSIKDKLD